MEIYVRKLTVQKFYLLMRAPWKSEWLTSENVRSSTYVFGNRKGPTDIVTWIIHLFCHHDFLFLLSIHTKINYLFCRVWSHLRHFHTLQLGIRLFSLLENKRRSRQARVELSQLEKCSDNSQCKIPNIMFPKFVQGFAHQCCVLFQ